MQKQVKLKEKGRTRPVAMIWNKCNKINIFVKLNIQLAQLSNGFVKAMMLTDWSGDGIRKEI